MRRRRHSTGNTERNHIEPARRIDGRCGGTGGSVSQATARLAVLPPTMYSTAQVQLAMYEHVSMLGGMYVLTKTRQ